MSEEDFKKEKQELAKSLGGLSKTITQSSSEVERASRKAAITMNKGIIQGTQQMEEIRKMAKDRITKSMIKSMDTEVSKVKNANKEGLKVITEATDSLFTSVDSMTTNFETINDSSEKMAKASSDIGDSVSEFGDMTAEHSDRLDYVMKGFESSSLKLAKGVFGATKAISFLSVKYGAKTGVAATKKAARIATAPIRAPLRVMGEARDKVLDPARQETDNIVDNFKGLLGAGLIGGKGGPVAADANAMVRTGFSSIFGKKGDEGEGGSGTISKILGASKDITLAGFGGLQNTMGEMVGWIKNIPGAKQGRDGNEWAKDLKRDAAKGSFRLASSGEIVGPEDDYEIKSDNRGANIILSTKEKDIDGGSEMDDPVVKRLEDIKQVAVAHAAHEGVQLRRMPGVRQGKSRILWTQNERESKDDKGPKSPEMPGFLGEQFSNIFGIKSVIGYALPFFGMGYRSELPNPRSIGVIPAIYKVLSLIYVHARFASDEINGLVYQQSRLIQEGFGIEGNLKRPKSRSIGQWLGSAIKSRIAQELIKQKQDPDSQLNKIMGQFIKSEEYQKMAGDLVDSYIEHGREADFKIAEGGQAGILIGIRDILQKQLEFFLNIKRFADGGTVGEHGGELIIAGEKGKEKISSAQETAQEEKSNVAQAKDKSKIRDEGLAKNKEGEEGGGGAKGIFGKIGAFFGALVNLKSIKESLLGMWESIKKIPSLLSNAIFGKIDGEGNTQGGIISLLIGIKDGIVAMATGLKEGLGSLWDDTEWKEGKFKGFQEKQGFIARFFDFVVSAISSGHSKLMETINKELDPANKSIGERLIFAYQKLVPQAVTSALFGDTDAEGKPTGIFGIMKGIFDAGLKAAKVFGEAGTTFFNAVKNFGDSLSKYKDSVKEIWNDKEAGGFKKLMAPLTEIPVLLKDFIDGTIKVGSGLMEIMNSQMELYYVPAKMKRIMKDMRVKLAKNILSDPFQHIYEAIEERMFDWALSSFHSLEGVIGAMFGSKDGAATAGVAYREAVWQKAAKKEKEGKAYIQRFGLPNLKGIWAGLGNIAWAGAKPYFDFVARLKDNIKELWAGVEFYARGKSSGGNLSIVSFVKSVMGDVLDTWTNIINVSHDIHDRFSDVWGVSVMGRDEATVSAMNQKPIKPQKPIESHAKGGVIGEGQPAGAPVDMVGHAGEGVLSLDGQNNKEMFSPVTTILEHMQAELEVHTGLLGRLIEETTNIYSGKGRKSHGIIGAIVSIPLKVTAGIAAGFRGIAGHIGAAVGEALKFPMKAINLGLEAVRATIHATSKAIGSALNTGFKALGYAVQAVGETIKVGWRGFKAVITAPFKFISNFLKKPWEAMKKGVTKLKDKLLGNEVIGVDSMGEPIKARWPGAIIRHLVGIKRNTSAMAAHFSGKEEGSDEAQEQSRYRGIWDRIKKKREKKDEKGGGGGMGGGVFGGMLGGIGPKLLAGLIPMIIAGAITGDVKTAMFAGGGGMIGGILGGIIGMAGGPVGSVAGFAVGTALGGLLGGFVVKPLSEVLGEHPIMGGVSLGVGAAVGAVLGGFLGSAVPVLGTIWGVGIGAALGGAITGFAIPKLADAFGPEVPAMAGTGAVLGGILGGMLAAPTLAGIPFGIAAGAAIGGAVGTVVGISGGFFGNMAEKLGLPREIGSGAGMGAAAGAILGGIVGTAMGGPIGLPIGLGLGAALGLAVGAIAGGAVWTIKKMIGVFGGDDKDMAKGGFASGAMNSTSAMATGALVGTILGFMMGGPAGAGIGAAAGAAAGPMIMLAMSAAKTAKELKAASESEKRLTQNQKAVRSMGGVMAGKEKGKLERLDSKAAEAIESEESQGKRKEEAGRLYRQELRNTKTEMDSSNSSVFTGWRESSVYQQRKSKLAELKTDEGKEKRLKQLEREIKEKERKRALEGMGQGIDYGSMSPEEKIKNISELLEAAKKEGNPDKVRQLEMRLKNTKLLKEREDNKMGAAPPKFHSGGIVEGQPGKDVPAILKAGEAVLTEKQQAAIGDFSHPDNKDWMKSKSLSKSMDLSEDDMMKKVIATTPLGWAINNWEKVDEGLTKAVFDWVNRPSDTDTMADKISNAVSSSISNVAGSAQRGQQAGAKAGRSVGGAIGGGFGKKAGGAIGGALGKVAGGATGLLDEATGGAIGMTPGSDYFDEQKRSISDSFMQDNAPAGGDAEVNNKTASIGAASISNGIAFPSDHKYITSPWGPRSVRGGSSYHKAVDIRAKTGDPIYASMGGVVVDAGGKYGGVVIDHGGGLKTRYLHMSSINVGPGQQISTGQVIGMAGGRGPSGPNSYPSHLHYEISKDGVKYDPENFLSKSGFAMTGLTNRDPGQFLTFPENAAVGGIEDPPSASINQSIPTRDRSALVDNSVSYDLARDQGTGNAVEKGMAGVGETMKKSQEQGLIVINNMVSSINSMASSLAGGGGNSDKFDEGADPDLHAILTGNL